MLRCIAESTTALAARRPKKVVSVERCVEMAAHVAELASVTSDRTPNEMYVTSTSSARTTPAEMKELLAKATFTGKGDEKKVFGLYSVVYKGGEQYDESRRMFML